MENLVQEPIKESARAVVKVSVPMVTYNHENFIAQAIEGVLAQETDFRYELIIGEDCSTDGTRAIVLDYQERHPDKIRLFLPDKNVGMHENFLQVFRACRGEYIALLEGDDYWTSPRKLQTQVEIMDAHPEYSMCFHNVTEIYEDGSQQPHNHRPSDQKEVSTLDDLLLVNFIPTCSVIFRHGLFGEIPAWYSTTKVDDWSLHVLNAQHGGIRYVNEVMGVYRHHAGGMWYHHHRSHVLRLRESIRAYESFRAHLGSEYFTRISALMARCHYDLAKSYADEGDLASARSCAAQCLVEREVVQYLSREKLLMLWSLCHAPVLYKMAMRLRRAVAHG
jgi:glycosyltransferase involved in cell wall biosynthesis